jgi:hypothetical protein
MDLPYQAMDLPVSNNEAIHAVIVKSKFETYRDKDFFFGHGFGGSSLMNFTVV